MLQLVQRAEVDEEEERLVMPSVKPDDAGKPDYDQIVLSRYVYFYDHDFSPSTKHRSVRMCRREQRGFKPTRGFAHRLL